jgi:hypothetical protein
MVEAFCYKPEVAFSNPNEVNEFLKSTLSLRPH